MLEAGTALRNLSGHLPFSCNSFSQTSALSIMTLTILIVLPCQTLKLCALQTCVRQHKVKPSCTPNPYSPALPQATYLIAYIGNQEIDCVCLFQFFFLTWLKMNLDQLPQ